MGSSQHQPTPHCCQHLHPRRVGSCSGCRRDKLHKSGRFGTGSSSCGAERDAARWGCVQTGSGCRSNSSQWCGSYDTAPSCTWGGGRERGARGGRGRTDSALRTYRNRWLSRWCRAPSCSGWSRGQGQERTLPEGAEPWPGRGRLHLTPHWTAGCPPAPHLGTEAETSHHFQSGRETGRHEAPSSNCTLAELHQIKATSY